MLQAIISGVIVTWLCIRDTKVGVFIVAVDIRKDVSCDPVRIRKEVFYDPEGRVKLWHQNPKYTILLCDMVISHRIRCFFFIMFGMFHSTANNYKLWKATSRMTLARAWSGGT